MKVFYSSHALALSLFSFLAQASPPPTNIQRSRPDAVNLAKRATCTPTAGGASSTDDVPAITSALSTCGNGGTIEIPAGKTYYLNTILDFSGCVGCTFNIEGTLMASDDLDYWEGKTAIIYIDDIQTATIQSLTGSGIIDGNGQAAWEEFASNSDYARPTLHYITGKSSGITIKNLQVKNPPNVFFSVNGDSTNIVYDSLTMSAVSDSDTAPKNTDGFDIGASTYVTLTNINVANQDDCVAFKPGCSYVSVDGITCSGSHGLSVGSLGSKNIDTVQNVYVTNATMIDSAKAVGIKLYPGGDHGQGIVKNVTYDGVTVTNCDYAAQIQSCYGGDADYCSEYPSNGTITDVVFKNFKGTTSDKYGPVTANLDCPADGTCGITFESWDIATPDGTAEVLCANTGSDIGVTCTDEASG